MALSLKSVRKKLGLPPISIKSLLGQGSKAHVGEAIGRGADVVMGQVGNGVPVGTAVSTTVGGAAAAIGDQVQSGVDAAKLYLDVKRAWDVFLDSPLPWVLLAILVTSRMGKR